MLTEKMIFLIFHESSCIQITKPIWYIQYVYNLLASNVLNITVLIELFNTEYIICSMLSFEKILTLFIQFIDDTYKILLKEPA